ncbi:hypothetical protein GCM10022261_24120 [Brevibacterium daeguense]|uniref:Maltokinase N-terminal cap domain-containing protein n=1 Tax=Brevibacterium daeguense TaxID=909936 RepID=A0ABP8ELQ8_9MICO|nr:hypothetical protein [Brevibacterium daeguense]
MALLYDAQLNPGKLQAIAGWLPNQSWTSVDPGAEAEGASSFRFDDPSGEVGIEVHLVTVEGALIQVPLSYRGAALEGAESHLVTEMDHSVLGRRWVYDATVDPIFISEALRTVAVEGPNAREFVRTDDGDIERTEIASVLGVLRDAGAAADLVTVSAELADRGAEALAGGAGAGPDSSGSRTAGPRTAVGVTSTVVGGFAIDVVRFPLAETGAQGSAGDGDVVGVLEGTWEGQDSPVELLRIRRVGAGGQ